jgi:4-diphosphocytidyl-2-C-methyl-D-erythritol kinase
MEEIAYAKINLALHVRERMPDGYHRIETLFAFCEDGDRLTASPRPLGLSLDVAGPFAGALAGENDNLVLAAARMVAPETGFHLHLEKRLPVAAGLGGGSADAAAAIRLLARNALPGSDEASLLGKAAALGADVPACIASRTCLGTGTGTELRAPGLDDASGRPVLLVNPGVPLATGPVFKGWDRVDRGPLAEGSVMTAALAGRNDLEAPAIALCPPIATVLGALRDLPGVVLARMSGSGATCFALFDSDEARADADAGLAARHPGWWRLVTRLR